MLKAAYFALAIVILSAGIVLAVLSYSEGYNHESLKSPTTIRRHRVVASGTETRSIPVLQHRSADFNLWLLSFGVLFSVLGVVMILKSDDIVGIITERSA